MNAHDASTRTAITSAADTDVQQQAEIQNLKAVNRAARKENLELRKAALTDQNEIRGLKADRESMETVIAQLKTAQRQNDALNADLQARNTALEALNKELESFSYAVSHDLRSPLRSIFGFGEALKRSMIGKLSNEEATWLDKILNAALRMDHLTEDLLRLSRLTRAQLDCQPLDLTTIAGEVIKELRQNDPSRDVTVSLPSAMPVRADPTLMRVVMTNLIENAWKYTGRRKQAVITLEYEREGRQAVVCVRDNGAGFDMAYSTKLFAPFQRLHSVREFPGSGVGLACVARVIHKHGGRVWAKAEPDKGAAIFFAIPDAATAAEEARVNEERGL